MSEETNEEIVEIEIDEEAIIGYLVDEDDNEIGLIYKDDNGKEVELYYDEIAKNDGEQSLVTEDSEEIEIDPDAILYYMVTPEGKEIGFVAKNEAGEKEEFLYPADAIAQFYLLTELEAKLRKASSVKGAASNLVNTGANTVGGVVNRVAGKEVIKGADTSPAKTDDGEDDGVTKDDLKEMFGTIKDVAVDGYAALSGVLDQVDDVRDQLDDINPKKRREQHRIERAQQKAAERQAEINAQAMANAGITGTGADVQSAGATLPPLNVKRELAPADSKDVALATAENADKESINSDGAVTSTPEVKTKIPDSKESKTEE